MRREIRVTLARIERLYGVRLEMETDLPEALRALEDYERHLEALARRQGKPLHTIPGGTLRRVKLERGGDASP